MVAREGTLFSDVHDNMPNLASETPVVPRPGLARQDTDALLSYYLSSPEDDKKSGLQRQSSVVSESSSDYSTSSSLSDYSMKESSPNSPKRRGGPSEGASDRRRLALVELDTASQVSNPSDSLRSRRGIENRIALVAPPDASARTYSSLTPPPPSAPVSGSMIHHDQAAPASDGDERGHHRSASDAAAKKSTSPRNVGIVGSRPLAPLILEPISPDGAHPPLTTSDITSLRPPIFIHPQSRSPSPAAFSADTPVFTFQTQSLATTPDIGEGKPIDKPVAPPVVVPLDNAIESGLSDAVSYLDYQPGLHATAGPLPAPPEDNSALKRPRKELEMVKQALQLPASVTAALAAKNKSIGKEVNLETNGLDSSINRPSHRREGAFAPSYASQESTPSDIQERTGKMHASDDIQSIVVQSPTTPDTSVPIRDPTWISEVSPEGRTSTDGRTSGELSTSSHTPSTMSHSTAPSPPPKSPKSFRTSLTKGLKRMSLPRSPSFKSLARSSSVGHSGSQPRTPSPSLPPPPPRQRPKIRSLYPAAMYCHEVYSQRNTQERCIIYAQKINELYSCDCGLGDWIFEAQIRRPNGSRSTLKLNANLSVPASQQFSPQPRHTSRSSMISDATFPNRPDATTATDLATKPEQLLAPNVPPPLPYPALAVNHSRSQGNGSTSSTPSSAGRPSKAGNFFASLGRKASISRKERPPGTPQPARLTKNPPSASRSNATVPGGPRAPGNRVSRSQTLMPPATPIADRSETNAEIYPTLNRSPSLTDLPSSAVLDIAADPDFARQVDRLADLLPHADRDVLAGYLRRAGQDMLAIGQYLEDERNGLIKPV